MYYHFCLMLFKGAFFITIERLYWPWVRCSWPSGYSPSCLRTACPRPTPPSSWSGGTVFRRRTPPANRRGRQSDPRGTFTLIEHCWVFRINIVNVLLSNSAKVHSSNAIEKVSKPCASLLYLDYLRGHILTFKLSHTLSYYCFYLLLTYFQFSFK